MQAQERAAKLEAAEEEAQALADLRADPRTFLAVHTGQDVIEVSNSSFAFSPSPYPHPLYTRVVVQSLPFSSEAPLSV